MSSAKEQLEKISNEISELQIKVDTFNSELFAKQDERRAVIRKYILEEELLKGTVWEPSGSCLYFKGKRSDHPLSKIDELFGADYHDLVYLDEGQKISLYFDDNTVYIAGNKGDYAELLKQYGLVIDSGKVDAQMEDLRRKLMNLQALKDSWK